MERTRSHSHVIIGLLIIIVGVISLLDNFDLIDAWQVFRFWPVIFIIFGYFKITGSMTTSGRIVGLLFAGLGVLMILDRLYYIDFHFWDWWPLILILIGAGLLLDRTSWQKKSPVDASAGENPPDHDSVVNMFAFMSGCKRVCSSQDFHGGEITAIMGGCEIDLRQASMKGDTAVIHIFTIWGGVTIKIPREWSVGSEGFPILGGIADKTQVVSAGAQKHLIIRGMVIMGGAEISN